MPAPPLESVRIDKWLWAARFFKTRTQATEACGGGLVKVDGEPVKPARMIKGGEMIEARTPGGKRIMRVIGLSEVRGPAAVAQTLYEDHTPPPPPDEPVALREWGTGRPTKRERRQMDRFRGDT